MLSFKLLSDEAIVFAFDVGCRDMYTIGHKGSVELRGQLEYDDITSTYFSNCRDAMLFGISQLERTEIDYLFKMCLVFENDGGEELDDSYQTFAYSELMHHELGLHKLTERSEFNHRAAFRAHARGDNEESERFLRSWAHLQQTIQGLKTRQALIKESLVYLGIESRECDECAGLGYTIGFEGSKKLRYKCESCK